VASWPCIGCLNASLPPSSKRVLTYEAPSEMSEDESGPKIEEMGDENAGAPEGSTTRVEVSLFASCAPAVWLIGCLIRRWRWRRVSRLRSYVGAIVLRSTGKSCGTTTKRPAARRSSASSQRVSRRCIAQAPCPRLWIKVTGVRLCRRHEPNRAVPLEPVGPAGTAPGGTAEQAGGEARAVARDGQAQACREEGGSRKGVPQS
jgi:hypothetical protein